METSGKATIVDDEYTYDHTGLGQKNVKKVLVKLAMINIEYTEPHAKGQRAGSRSWSRTEYDWFLRTVAVHHDSGSVLKNSVKRNKCISYEQ